MSSKKLESSTFFLRFEKSASAKNKPWFLDPPRSAKWMVRGAILQALRVHAGCPTFLVQKTWFSTPKPYVGSQWLAGLGDRCEPKKTTLHLHAGRVTETETCQGLYHWILWCQSSHCEHRPRGWQQRVVLLQPLAAKPPCQTGGWSCWNPLKHQKI